MKKVIAAVLLAALLAGPLSAQDRRNELGLAYSQFTVPQAVYVFAGVLGMVFSLGNFSMENTALPGALSLEYTHFINETFGFGGSITGDFMTADKYTGKDDNRQYAGKFNMAFCTVMPHAKAYWFNHPHFGMYSKLAAGVGGTIQNEGDPSLTFAFQLSPVSMDFGGDAWRGYFELGFGMQGIATLGIKKIF